MGGKDISPYGEKSQYDPSFRGPTESRSCTDVICTIIFILFLAGYFAVGILAWVYGDPRQLLYPRNSTGSYCGVGENLDKPNLLYFNIIKCAAGLKNPLTVAMKGLQCPTTQICVSNCSDKFWVVPLAAFLPGVIPYTVWNQRFCQPKIDLMTTTLTVPEILSQQLCPEFTIPTVSTINRCFPSFDTSDVANFNVNGMTQNETLGSIIQGTQQLVASFSLRDIGLKIFEDLSRSWHWILIYVLVAMVLSLLFLLLLRFAAAILVWLLIVGVLVTVAFGIYQCYLEYNRLNIKGASIHDVATDLRDLGGVKESWLAALIILSVVEVILLLALLFLRKRIFIAIALIREASRAIAHIMSTLAYPLLTFSLIMICVAYWALTSLYLATSGEALYRITPTNHSAAGCDKYSGNESCNPLDFQASNTLPCVTECVFFMYNNEGLFLRNLFNLQIYNFLAVLWCINFVIALGQCVLAGTFASYYWAFNKPADIPHCVLTRTFLRTLRYHVGSLAFGSLILTIVQMIRIFLIYMDHKLKDSNNRVARCLLCCMKCCFWCLERCLKFLNRNAYIMIAIYGKNFCSSARHAYKLLMRNIGKVVILDKITDLLLLFGKLLVAGGVSTLAFYFFTGRIRNSDPRFQAPVLNYYWLPILVVFLGSFVIAQGFFSVYSMCVDTLFLCFLEDLERNDGSMEKPYYMSKSLMEILNKENKSAKQK